MVCQTVKFALLLGAIIAVSVSPARADDAVVPAPVPVPVPAATNCGPAMRTITECVPETYVAKKRTYKVVCRTEEYDACKWQCVPEVRQRTCPVVKIVVVQTPETRKVCKLVTVIRRTASFLEPSPVNSRKLKKLKIGSRLMFDAVTGAVLYYYGLKEFSYYTVMFAVARSLGLTAQTVIN